MLLQNRGRGSVGGFTLLKFVYISGQDIQQIGSVGMASNPWPRLHMFTKQCGQPDVYLQTWTKPNGPLTQPEPPNSNLPGYQPSS